MPARLVRPSVVAAFGVLALVTTSACTSEAPAGQVSGTRTTPAASADPTSSATSTPTGTATTPARARPLVVDAVFDHTTLDPTRQFDRTGSLLSHALYETLTTLDPDDPTTVVPGLADYTIAPEGRWLTLRLREGVVFSDGSPMTTDDVVFTLERAKGLRGPASSILGSVTVLKVDDRTVTLSSPGSNFALPAILANPAFGILNSAAVKSHGGTIGPGDTAATWLSTHSAGSGPYVLDGVTGTREVRLTANPSRAGTEPAFPDVVLRNRTPREQLADVTSGAADVVLDLSASQANATATKAPGPAVTVTTVRSSSLAYLALNRTKGLNRWTADPDFAQAVRLGIDRRALGLAVPGATPAAGLVPAGIVGALDDLSPTPGLPPSPTTAGTGTGSGTGTPAPGATSDSPSATATDVPTVPDGIPSPVVTVPVVPERDLVRAKAALARSGYAGQAIPLTYAADLPVQGVPTSALAALVRAQLAQVGIKVVLNPAPAREALAAYRSGRSAFSLWGWSPDYPDPENYLAFAPGELVGLRAGWTRGSDPLVDDLTEGARDSVGDDRAAAYAAWQVAMNARSPFVPLIQPSTRFASGPRVAQVPGNPVWTLDLARIR
ncbi:ABC transporter substrate-binding protein [Terrabacter sp. NPDC000476]|uniref:ABC transporter substrate-binding protein n=1 Tax=Terrabacter sp. NPDC000476 TaxID=3154258 RepID=UPI00331C777F